MLNYNSPKKNKSHMVKHNNQRISMRNEDDMDINMRSNRRRCDVDRIMLERQLTSHNFDNDTDYVGEITGEKLADFDGYDKGMPMRSSFTLKKAKYDNTHHDFDLYDKTGRHEKTNVQYSDNYSGDYADIDESMKTITNSTDPYETCISNISSTTCWLHSNMFMLSKNDYIVNGFGLFSSMGVIYLMSNNNIQLELKNYFDYQDKKHLNAGLLTIKGLIGNKGDQLIIDNYIITDNIVPLSTVIAKRLKLLLFNIIVNKNHINSETHKVNNIIGTHSKIYNVVSQNTLSFGHISLISVCKINPTWFYKIDNIIKIKFNGIPRKFVRYVGKTFDYYEDSERQIIEIPFYNDDIAFGIILSKHNQNSSSDLKILNTSISYLKPTVLEEVLFPIFKKRYKTRLNKTLQKTGLTSIFEEKNIHRLYPEGANLDDYIQYTDVIISDKCSNKLSNNKGYKTVRKFIANRMFEYYIRLTDINCILLMGRLC